MAESQLRAIIFVPIQNFKDDVIFDEVEDFFSDDDFTAAFVKVRREFSKKLRWKFGPLTPLTDDGIPGQPFNAAIAADLPIALSNLVGYNFGENRLDETQENFWQSRRHLNLIGFEIGSGIPGVSTEGFELFKYPENDLSNHNFAETFVLAIHVVTNDNPTNRKTLLELSKLSNDSIKKFLNTYFRTPFNSVFSMPSDEKGLPNKYDILKADNNPADYGWNFHPLIRTSLIAFYGKGEGASPSFKHANLELTHDGSTRSIAQLKSKLAFIGTVLTFKKLRLDSLRKQWPKLENLTETEVISLRAQLSTLRNTWFWNRISYDDLIQKTYLAWTNELDLNPDLELMGKDIDEYWIVKAAQKASEEAIEIHKLNKLAKIFAVFGIVPAWLSLLVYPLNGWVAFGVSAFAIAGLFTFRKSVERFINRII